MNRRDFLKVSGATIVGGLLLPINPNSNIMDLQNPNPQFSILTTPSLDMDVLVGKKKLWDNSKGFTRAIIRICASLWY